jgi:hypothetical protein
MNISDIIARPLLAITPNKEINYNTAHQAGLGTIWAALPVTTIKLLGGSWKSTIPAAIGGFAAGVGALPLHNALVRYKQKQQLENAKEAIRQHVFPQSDFGLKAKNIGKAIIRMNTNIANNPDLSKQAGIVGSIASTAGKAMWGATKAVGQGLMPTSKNASIGRKIIGGSVKAGTLGSAGILGYKGIDYMSKQPISYNYNTMLRNNLLYGNIHPAELNSSEIQEVRNIGWK